MIEFPAINQGYSKRQKDEITGSRNWPHSLLLAFAYLSDSPFLRKMVQRLPKAVRPKATYYGHVIAINEQGHVVENLQDPSGRYATNTSVYETPDYLYIGSLLAETLGRLTK